MRRLQLAVDCTEEIRLWNKKAPLSAAARRRGGAEATLTFLGYRTTACKLGMSDWDCLALSLVAKLASPPPLPYVGWLFYSESNSTYQTRIWSDANYRCRRIPPYQFPAHPTPPRLPEERLLISDGEGTKRGPDAILRQSVPPHARTTIII